MYCVINMLSTEGSSTQPSGAQMLITICARGGSKGVIGKNIRKVAGKPLLLYTIDHAKQFAAMHKTDIALSTDSDEIREIAAKNGLVSQYVRPKELASDKAGKIAAIRDILLVEEKRRGERYAYVLDLDVTSPMRTTQDIDDALQSFIDDPHALNLFSVSPAERNPYFNMVESVNDRYYHLVKTLDSPVLSRQTSPAVYQLNASFYIFRRAFFDTKHSTVFTERSLVYLVQHACFDLDTELDFLFLEFLLERNYWTFR